MISYDLKIQFSTQSGLPVAVSDGREVRTVNHCLTFLRNRKKFEVTYKIVKKRGDTVWYSKRSA